MTTPTREELLKLAKQAGAFEGFGDDKGNDDFVFAETALQRFAALLSAHQAQGEQNPVYQWRKRSQNGAWYDTTKADAYSRVDDHYEARTLYAAPPSSAQTDQVWNEAVEAAAKICAKRKLFELADAIRSLKRPLQAQEPSCPACHGNDGDMPCAYPSEGIKGCLRDERLASPAAQSGADELPSVPSEIINAISHYGDERDGGTNSAQAFGDVVRLIRVELSRAQTEPALSRAKLTKFTDQYCFGRPDLVACAESLFDFLRSGETEQTAPAVDLASVSDEERAAFEAWSKREGALNLMAARDAECEDGRFPATYHYASTETAWRAWANGRAALSRPSAPAPVSEQPAAQTAGVPDHGVVAREVRQMLYQGYSIGVNHYGDALLLKDGYTVAIIKETLENLRPVLVDPKSQPVAEQMGEEIRLVRDGLRAATEAIRWAELHTGETTADKYVQAAKKALPLAVTAVGELAGFLANTKAAQAKGGDK